MKKIYLLIALGFSMYSGAQEYKVTSDLKYNTPTIKFTQGYVTSGIVELMLINTDTFEDAPILRKAIGLLTSMAVETGFNGVKSNRMGYVALGSVSASITIEIFKPQRRSYNCNRRSIW